MRVAFILLLILVGSITISGIGQSFAEKGEIPDWVKTTLALWSDGEITNDDFELASSIAARFSQGREAEQVTVKIKQLNGEEHLITVSPMPPSEIQKNWYV